jgi:hypothetical protein
MNAERFRAHLIELRFIDRDAIEGVGICPHTAAQMTRDPILTFLGMSTKERARFWPLVEAQVKRNRKIIDDYLAEATEMTK